MKKRVTIFLLMSVLMMSMAASVALAVDTIYVNGTVITMNGDQIAEAVAVTGDRIEAVGTNQDILALADAETEAVNLAGRVLMPGFIDAHSHMLWYGLSTTAMVNLQCPALGGDVANIEQLVAKLEAKAQTLTSPDEWIQGVNYDDTMLTDLRHPTRWDLDRVSGDHPIYVQHIAVGHIGVANSKALQLAGIDAHTPDPPGAVIDRDPVTGEPTGLLREFAATNMVLNLIPANTPQEYLAGLVYGTQNYIAQGVTTALEGFRGNWVLPVYRAGLQMGLLKNRVVLYMSGAAANILPAFPNLRTGDDLTDNHMLTLGAAKEYADGSIQAYTGFLTEPYYVQPEGETDYAGFAANTQQALIDWATPYHNAGWQLAVHANGDAAIENTLNAFEAVQANNPRADSRPTLIHAQAARDDQVERMADLGVIPTFFVSHTYYWGDRHWNIFLGPERAARISPCKSALDRNIPFTIHTDTPVVPISVMHSVWTAVNRISSGGSIIGADQRIPVMDALRAVTINAANQYFEENLKGSIEPGKLADFVVLGDNPLTVDSMAIKDIPVVATIVGNQVVYGDLTTADAGSGGSSSGCFISSLTSH